MKSLLSYFFYFFILFPLDTQIQSGNHTSNMGKTAGSYEIGTHSRGTGLKSPSGKPSKNKNNMV